MHIALLPVLFNQETNQCNPYDWNGLRSYLLLLPVHLQNVVSQGVLIQTISFVTPFPSHCVPRGLLYSYIIHQST